MPPATCSATSSWTTSRPPASGRSASSASTSATGSWPGTSKQSKDAVPGTASLGLGFRREHPRQEVLGSLDVLADQLAGAVGVALAEQRDQRAVLIVRALQHLLRVRHQLDHLVEL